MRVRKLLAVLSTAVLVLVGLGRQVLATHGEVHGYCENGKPVIQEWPDKYKDYHVECWGGNIAVVPNNELEPPPPLERMEEPDDFWNWAHITLNGEAVINPYRDIDPFITKSTGRTLIPVRMVTEAMGGTTEWDKAKAQVTIRLGDKYMIMTIGKAEAIANGYTITLDQPPLLIRDRTMVPLRAVMEAFGVTVTWKGPTREIDIDLPGVRCDPKYCSW